LLVEDDYDVRDALVPILEYDGHRVSSAANGREALDQLRANPAPSLILLDLMMPVMDGIAFRTEQLRDPELASIPVVVVSADPALREKAIRLGAVGWIEKPIDIDVLLDEVRRAAQPRATPNAAAADTTFAGRR